jgi:hypothetical protein
MQRRQFEVRVRRMIALVGGRSAGRVRAVELMISFIDFTTVSRSTFCDLLPQRAPYVFADDTRSNVGGPASGWPPAPEARQAGCRAKCDRHRTLFAGTAQLRRLRRT